MNNELMSARIVCVTVAIVMIVGIIGICYNSYLETRLAQEAMKQGYSQVREGSISQPLWKKVQ